MPGSGPRSINCLVCCKRTKPSNRRPVNAAIGRVLQKKFFINALQTDVICDKCRHKHYVAETKHQSKTNCTTQNITDPDWQPEVRGAKQLMASPPSVTLKIPSSSKSHSRCIMCKKPGPKLIVVPAKARFSAFLDNNIIISSGSRCCPGHICDDQIRADSLERIEHSASSYVNRKTITDLLQGLREACRNMKDRLTFESLQDSEYSNLTGLNKSDFEDLCSVFAGQVRDTPVRSLKTTVGLFLLKLKSGMANKLLATLFGITISSVRRAIQTVRKHLISSFVPQHLGFPHISREDVINNHTRPLAQTLFGQDGSGDNPKLILVLDGTYIYIQKSNNFQFQRRSYSMHKGRPLVKPMVIVSTSGYFISIIGPYLADGRNNDAKILNHILQTNIEQIKEYVHAEDIFVVDRGFRDSLSMLEDMGIQAEMPSFMEKGQKQLRTEDANSSRLVTKIRWIVESANARIKRWKYLDRVIPNSQIPFIGDYVRIVCAICNKYLPTLCGRSDQEEEATLATKLRELSLHVNRLQMYIEENSLERKSVCWKSVQECDLQHFPRLSEEQIRSLTCGVYQLKLAPSYIQEHMQGNCDINVHAENPNLIRVRMRSRHISAKTYLLWIQFNQTDVTAWFCKCRAGSRVVGVCSHIAAIIWYLGFAKYQTDISNVGVRNWGHNILDASDIPKCIDSSSDSEDESDV